MFQGVYIMNVQKAFSQIKFVTVLQYHCRLALEIFSLQYMLTKRFSGSSSSLQMSIHSVLFQVEFWITGIWQVNTILRARLRYWDWNTYLAQVTCDNFHQSNIYIPIDNLLKVYFFYCALPEGCVWLFDIIIRFILQWQHLPTNIACLIFFFLYWSVINRTFFDIG